MGEDDQELALDWVVHMCAVCSLAAVVWEWLITLDVEVQFIWPKPYTAWIKWVFLFVRYHPLVLLAVNLVNELILPIAPFGICRGWFMWQVFVAQSMLTFTELILVSRVHALYERSRTVIGFLSGLILTELVMEIIALCLTFHRLTFDSDKGCFLAETPQPFIYPRAATVLTQLTILFLTIYKCTRNVRLRKLQIIRLTLRDGTWAFLCVFAALLACSLMYVEHIHNQASSVKYWVRIHTWFLAILSTADCRLIINMQTLGPPKDGIDPMFTTLHTTILETGTLD